MVTSVLGWIGDVLLIWGYWEIGNKKRWAHILSFLGELAWITKSLILGQFDLLIICVVFGFLAIRNYMKWSK